MGIPAGQVESKKVVLCETARISDSMIIINISGLIRDSCIYIEPFCQPVIDRPPALD